MKITISKNIKQAAPKIELGIIESDIKFTKFDAELWKMIKKEVEQISEMTSETIKERATIFSTREAYKKLGKEPSRYRPSAEALHRRIIKGKGMYKISTPVDIINLSSMKTGYSIGGYDAEKINGVIKFDKGKADAEYQAIGRGIMNVENLPVFFDETGAFGSPTSDSERTMITDKTQNIILLVMNFGGHKYFEKSLNYISNLLERYCSAENLTIRIEK
ncbi:MAG: phenylalanine--tRNA ligase beta subunit-related protein [Bacteroidota bacterium]|nr:phenylalanine--tRNA ligase beta subunit-related protein [Bacteroidota bacterium]